jgi:ATP-dependent DNA helicase RecQ
VPVLALTATATPEVMADIVDQLAMDRPACYRGSFFRPNLQLSAYRKGEGGDVGRTRGTGGKGVRGAIVALVEARRGQSGIIYASSRKACESLAEHLRRRGIRAAAYHAGLEPAERSSAQEAFSRDDIEVVVATIAFGMGIDKSNVRYVIHRDMPRSIESYYQEVGRAGRDGLASDCILFYSWADVLAYDRFEDDGDEAGAARRRDQARDMFRLAAAEGCRHRSIARRLGETIPACSVSCDACAGWDRLGASRAAGAAAHAGGLGSDVEPGAPLPAADELVERLKGIRKRLAAERAVPAYVIFNDATLHDIVAKRPRNAEALLAISGIGPKKLELYGAALLEAVATEAPPGDERLP